MFAYADHSPTTTLGLFLLPGFAPSEVGVLLDAAAAVNGVAGAVCYRVRVYSLDGAPVPDQHGRAMPVDAAWPDDPPPMLLAVLAATLPDHLPGANDPHVVALARYARTRTGTQRLIGGVHAGPFWLAAAGLLDGRRATVHWTLVERFAETFPEVIVSTHLYEVDGHLATCGGGVAAADLFLQIALHQFGPQAATVAAERLLMERLRGRDDRQRIPLQSRVGANQPKLVQAVMLMEANLEEPLTTDEIASHVGVSRRQLERLFKQHLDRVPSQYYLELRLDRARQLLRQSSKSIIQIGLSCGFSSGPHFSSAYRNHFGCSPRDDRQMRPATPGAPASSSGQR
jgi:transcriptional regulator GlxA family with amidase domain